MNRTSDLCWYTDCFVVFLISKSFSQLIVTEGQQLSSHFVLVCLLKRTHKIRQLNRYLDVVLLGSQA